jgi:hypothetical protein
MQKNRFPGHSQDKRNLPLCFRIYPDEADNEEKASEKQKERKKKEIPKGRVDIQYELEEP